MKLFAIGLAGLFMYQANAQDNNISRKVTDVWIVVKSHFDLGFTDLAENVFQRYRTEMMDRSLKVMDVNKSLSKENQFVWTVPGWPLFAQMLGPKQDSIRKKRIEQAVRDGMLTPHALAFSTHTESQDLEDLVRSLSYSSNVCRQYGLPIPIAAKMTDVPSHSWILPTLLHHAGIKFLHIGVNPASQYPRVPQLFWWEGADQSRILCGYTIDYGSSFLPPADWPCKNYLSMIMAGDNHGPPTPEEVAKWRKQYQEKMPDVKVHFGTLDDFAKAVLAEKPELPVVKGDMPDTWIHGVMAMPQATKTARNIRPFEPALETFNTHLSYWGLRPGNISKQLAKSYEQSLLYSEHTWGMNAEYGPRRLYENDWKKWLTEMENEPIPADGDYSRLPRGSKRKWLQSYNDHRAYANTAAAIIDTAFKARLQLLASSVKVKEKSIVVYNALPWKRSGIVEVEGEKIFVEEVPANGYKTIPFRKNIKHTITEQTGSRIETKYFVAVFDLEKGGIHSLINKTTGKELVDQSSVYILGQFLHERFSTNEVYDRFFNRYSRLKDGWALNDLGKPGMPDATRVPYLASTPGNWKISNIQSEIEDRIILTTTDTKGLAKRYTITFTFPKNMPYIDVMWNVDTKTADKQPEGGWLCFPFNIQQPKFTVGRLGAPIDPANDIIPGTNRHLYAVTTGVAIDGKNGGVGLCPVDAPLISLDEPGLWRWSMDFVPKTPTVFVNLYNNMWNTNFPLWQDGSWSEQVRLWPMENNNINLAVLSWETRLPLQAAIANNTSAVLPPAKSGLTVSRKGVLVTAFGDEFNGNKGTLLRLWDQSGVSGPVKINLPDGMKVTKAVAVNLRGEKLDVPVIKIVHNEFYFSLHQFSPASFILE